MQDHQSRISFITLQAPQSHLHTRKEDYKKILNNNQMIEALIFCLSLLFAAYTKALSEHFYLKLHT